MSAETIGPYRILRRLGAGGMGDVHLGITESGRPVAVKTVRKQYAADTEFRRRFAQEVNVARLVGGAFTAAVVDADTEAELPWLATEFVAGPSLQQAVARHGKMDGAALQVLGAGLVEALGKIHRVGIIHRDLNPSNILLTRDGPRVIDFGISKPAKDATLTATGGIIGTPASCRLSTPQARNSLRPATCSRSALCWRSPRPGSRPSATGPPRFCSTARPRSRHIWTEHRRS